MFFVINIEILILQNNMYQINHPLTGELVNVYADNVPASEGTIMDLSYPVRKQCVTVDKEDRYYSTIRIYL